MLVGAETRDLGPEPCWLDPDPPPLGIMVLFSLVVNVVSVAITLLRHGHYRTSTTNWDINGPALSRFAQAHLESQQTKRRLAIKDYSVQCIIRFIQSRSSS
jgi:hypothetical protein